MTVNKYQKQKAGRKPKTSKTKGKTGAMKNSNRRGKKK